MTPLLPAVTIPGPPSPNANFGARMVLDLRRQRPLQHQDNHIDVFRDHVQGWLPSGQLLEFEMDTVACFTTAVPAVPHAIQ